MAQLMTTSVVRQIGSLFDGGSVAGLSDRHLIDRFVDRRDPAGEAAFAALVARHGPMVLGACRQLLGDRHLAEDAFQAVFLVLARKAGSIRDPDLLGNWLYGVALRTSRKARVRRARRRKGEEDRSMRDPGPRSIAPAEQPILAREQAEALHDEIERLPGAFRLPIVLCYFEGLTLDEAARRLRCPAGTLRSRLARARDKLRRGLTRRGVVLPAAALAAVLDSRAASASVSSPLCDITTRAAIRFAAAPDATALAREVLRSMLMHKLKITAMALMLVSAITSGTVYLTHALAMRDEPRKGTAGPQPKVDAKRDDAPAPGRMFVTGRVVDPQGKPVPNATAMVHAQAKVPGFVGGFEKRFPSAIGRATTDASGRFRLDAARISSATHSRIGATAIAPGYGAGWAELDPDVDRPDVEISLRPEQVIEGRLFDLNGRPAPGVSVAVDAMGRAVRRDSINAPDGLEGPTFWWAGAKDLPAWPRPATSDREGRFTLHGIGREIRAVLVVDDPRFAARRIEVDTDGTSASKAVTIALEPAASLDGRVTYADTGKPAARALIQVFTDGKGLVDEVMTDDDGRFRVTPVSGGQLSVAAFAPRGEPYHSTGKHFDWPKGAIRHSLELSLVRGVAVHGKVTEEGSGKPVAGAMVDFLSRETRPEAGQAFSETGPDGSFRIAARPGPGYLIVRGPSDDHVFQEFGQNLIRGGHPGGPRTYAHAFIACDVKPGGEGYEVNAELRRGVTLQGRAIGPDDRPVRDARIIARLFLYPPFRSWTFWLGSEHGRVRDGRFELHGLDPDAEVPIHVFDPKHQLGATVRVSGKSASGGPITVRLEPCGTATARFVAAGGKPVTGYHPMIRMVVTPGADPFTEEDKAGRLLVEQAALSVIDPLNYGTGPVSDGQGRVTLPALIPGASYRIYDSTTLGGAGSRPIRKEFTVKPGETLGLGDIWIEKPPPR
jgi:RNA polymerase sigma factor (sigma-70 family)